MSGRLITDQALADLLGITVDNVRAKCRPGAPGQWPCVKPKRTVWLFTEAMVEDIIARETVLPSTKKSPAKSGQTQRSRARAS